MIAKDEEHCHTTEVVGELVEGIVGNHVGCLSLEWKRSDKRAGGFAT